MFTVKVVVLAESAPLVYVILAVFLSVPLLLMKSMIEQSANALKVIFTESPGAMLETENTGMAGLVILYCDTPVPDTVLAIYRIPEGIL
jgi:hypothetical protein